VISSTVATRGVVERFSITMIRTPPTMKAIATLIGLKRVALIQWLNVSPSAAAGRKATRRLVTKRCARGSDPSP